MKKVKQIKQEEQLIPWREAFPEYKDHEIPGIILSGAIEKEGVTRHELSIMTGINLYDIIDMEQGKKEIDLESAKKFGEALNVGYRVFLNERSKND